MKKAAKAHSRNMYLDSLKGLAILLVVFGHSVQSAYIINGEFDQNLLFRVIYSFHMPLFMFLSGAVAVYGTNQMGWSFIKKKFYILVIPFFAWYLVSYFINTTFLKTNIFSYFYGLIYDPDRGLWFLWVLFLAFCSLVVIKKMQRIFGLWAYVVFWFCILALPMVHYGIGLLKWQLPFFLIGYLTFSYRDKLKNYANPILIISVICFPILALTWHRLSLPYSITALELKLLHHNLLTISVGDFLSINLYQIIVTLYKYTVAFAGIGFIFWLMRQGPLKWSYKYLTFIGLYTLDIYAIHFYFLKFAFGPTWLYITTGFAISLIASMLIGIFIIRKVPILDKVLLGGRVVK